MLLALHNVARFYGSRLIFKDVSLAVRPGTVTLLAGANGAGKTTLLKIMAGLVPPSSGSVETGYVHTQGREREEPGREPRLGFLGHQTFIYPELTALENLKFWSGLHQRNRDEKALLAALEQVELAPFAEEKAGGFSRGMAQRLNLARIFLLKPDILLLDEPATGLDVRSTTILHSAVAAARAEGSGVVWITHSLEEDLVRADKVALMSGKRLQFYGSIEEYRIFAREGTVPPPLFPSCLAGPGQGGLPC